MGSNGCIVLLAEDDSNDALLIQKAISKLAHVHVVKHVRSGGEVIRYLKGEPPYNDRLMFPFPSFLLLDLKMPGEDGFDVLKWLQTHPESSLPAIVLTGSILPQDKVRSLSLGANEFHQKPCVFDETLALAQALCSRWCPLAGATVS